MSEEVNLVENNEGLTPDGLAMQRIISVISADPSVVDKHPHLKDFLGVKPKEEGGKEPPTPPTVKTNVKAPPKKTPFNSVEDSGGDDYESLDAIKDRISKFGIQNGDIKTFFESSQKWRNDSMNYSGVANKVAEYEKVINDLPADISNAIQLWASNQDYKAAFSGLDYTKLFDQQSKYDILKEFAPGAFTEDEINDQANMEVKRALTVARQAYDIKRNQTLQMYNSRKRPAAIDEARKNAATNTLTHLRQLYPNTEERIVSEVQKIIGTGDNIGVLGLLFEPDGKIREDAAEKIMLGLFAKEELAAKDRIIKELEDQLKGKTQFSKVGNLANRSGNQGKTNPELTEKISALGNYVSQKTY